MCFIIYNRIEEDRDSVTHTEGEKQTEKRVCRWQKSQPPERNTDFRGAPFTVPDDSVRYMTPLHYFKLFWDDDVITMLVEQNNLYSVQTTGNSIRTNIKEMEQLIGMQMMMSLMQLPIYEMDWNTTSWVENIASIMPIKRYELLR